MNILLIQPPKAAVTIGGEDVFLYEPLALEYVAAGVAQDHDVRILDMRLDKDLPATLADFQPDVVGITAYTVHVNVARRIFDQVKQWNPRARSRWPAATTQRWRRRTFSGPPST